MKSKHSVCLYLLIRLGSTDEKTCFFVLACSIVLLRSVVLLVGCLPPDLQKFDIMGISVRLDAILDLKLVLIHKGWPWIFIVEGVGPVLCLN